jgi:hypothetical protein
VTQNGSGLTNQLFAFVSAIMLCIKKNDEEEEVKIICDQFSSDAFNGDRIPVSEVFDLEQLNQFLIM